LNTHDFPPATVTETTDIATPIALAWFDLLGKTLPVLASASLLLSCVLVSPKKELWVDEGYTLQVVADPSARHILHALANGVDGGMPLYYLLAHFWAGIFGSTLTSLRLLTSLLIVGGTLILWRELRRFYSPPAVALGISLTLLISPLLLKQNTELRFYGLFFLCAALVFAVDDRLSQGDHGKKLVIAAVAAHAALLLSHLFGVFYSGASILALVFADYRRRNLRWGLYATLTSSWAVLLIWIGPILKILDLGRPHNWSPRPTVVILSKFVAALSMGFWIGLLFSIGILLISKRSEREPFDSASGVVLLQAVAWLLVPVALAAAACVSSCPFVDRYFLPSLLGETALLVWLLDLTMQKLRLWTGTIWKLALTITMFSAIAWPIYTSFSGEKDITFQWLNHSLGSELPVLVEDANTFIPLTYYAGPGPGYYYVLDWTSAVHSQSLHATVQSKLMRNAKIVGYNRDRILDATEAQCNFDSFIVLDSPGIAWFKSHIADNAAFTVQKLGDLGFGDPGPAHVWLVNRLYRSPECTHSSKK
jgi:hypothetical protein